MVITNIKIFHKRDPPKITQIGIFGWKTNHLATLVCAERRNGFQNSNLADDAADAEMRQQITQSLRAELELREVEAEEVTEEVPCRLSINTFSSALKNAVA
jgi:hypothetical protein